MAQSEQIILPERVATTINGTEGHTISPASRILAMRNTLGRLAGQCSLNGASSLYGVILAKTIIRNEEGQRPLRDRHGRFQRNERGDIIKEQANFKCAGIEATGYGQLWHMALDMMEHPVIVNMRLNQDSLGASLLISFNTILKYKCPDILQADYERLAVGFTTETFKFGYSKHGQADTEEIAYLKEEDIRYTEKVFFNSPISSLIQQSSTEDIDFALAVATITLCSFARMARIDSLPVFLKYSTYMTMTEMLVPVLAYFGRDDLFKFVIDEIGINFNPNIIAQTTIKICESINPSYRVQAARVHEITYPKAEASRFSAIKQYERRVSQCLFPLINSGTITLQSSRAKSAYTALEKSTQRRRSIPDLSETTDVINLAKSYFQMKRPSSPFLQMVDLKDVEYEARQWIASEYFFDILAVQFIDEEGIIGDGITGVAENDDACITRINNFLRSLHEASGGQIVPLYLTKEYLEQVASSNLGSRSPFLNIKVAIDDMIAEIRVIRKKDKAMWALRHRLYKLKRSYPTDVLLNNKFLLLSILINGGIEIKDAYSIIPELLGIKDLSEREKKLYKALGLIEDSEPVSLTT